MFEEHAISKHCPILEALGHVTFYLYTLYFWIGIINILFNCFFLDWAHLTSLKVHSAE